VEAVNEWCCCGARLAIVLMGETVDVGQGNLEYSFKFAPRSQGYGN